MLNFEAFSHFSGFNGLRILGMGLWEQGTEETETGNGAKAEGNVGERRGVAGISWTFHKCE